jgi:hypothetical protein
MGLSMSVSLSNWIMGLQMICHCTSVTDVNGDKGVKDNCVFGTFWAAKAKTLGAQISRKKSRQRQ